MCWMQGVDACPAKVARLVPLPALCIGASNSRRRFREGGCAQQVQQHLPAQDAHLLAILWHVRAEDVQPSADTAALQRAAPLPVLVHKVPELVPEDGRLDSISQCQFAQKLPCGSCQSASSKT